MIYFDNNATTPCDPKISLLINDLLNNYNIGNPSSNHQSGWYANEIYEESRETISQYFNALPDDIIFTSGATESNNLAIGGIILSAHLNSNQRKKIIISSIEHKCVINSAYFYANLFNFEVIIVPVCKNGLIDFDYLEKHLSDDVLIASIMTTNNEIGTIQPIKEIGQLCKKFGVIFHTDMAQAYYDEIDMVEFGIDLISLSGHKIHAPVGVGALIIDSMIDVKPQPILHGGLQQSSYRSGTIPIVLCKALAETVKILRENRHYEKNTLLELRNYCLSSFEKADIPFTINGSLISRHPGNLNISIPGIDNQMLVMNLQPHIALSTGSACNAGIIEDSYVLKALGLLSEKSKQSIRLCFSRFNTKNEIDFFASLLKEKLDQAVDF